MGSLSSRYLDRLTGSSSPSCSVFYEGSVTHLRFEVSADGTVTGMTVFHDGGTDGEAAQKIE
jgi:hypothetical protein